MARRRRRNSGYAFDNGTIFVDPHPGPRGWHVISALLYRDDSDPDPDTYDISEEIRGKPPAIKYAKRLAEELVAEGTVRSLAVLFDGGEIAFFGD